MNKVTAEQTVLIVEDSAEDFYTIQRAFQECKIKNPIIHCETGEECLDYLHQRGKYTHQVNGVKPGIIFLDLNIPGTDGRGVIHILKQNPDFKEIPVIIFTTSIAPIDIDFCYRMGADNFIPKPLDYKEFIKTISELRDIWFEPCEQ